jgi:Fe-S-cluster-containing dehydrogenase component
MEKCTMCVQRIRRASRGKDHVEDGVFAPACVQACPTSALNFGNLEDESSRVFELLHDERNYTVLKNLGTKPNVTYLKKVDQA